MNTKQLVLFLALFTIGSSQAQVNLQLNAHLKGLPDNTLIFLQDLYDQQDEAYTVVKNNRFSFTKSLKEGSLYRIRAGKSTSDENMMYIYLHPDSKIDMKGESALLKDAQLTGNPYIVDWGELWHKVNYDSTYATWLNLFVTLINSIQAAYGDSAELSKLYPDKEKVYALSLRIADDWLAKHPGSLMNAYVVEQFLFQLLRFKVIVTPDQVERYLNKLPAEARNNKIAGMITKNLDAKKIYQ